MAQARRIKKEKPPKPPSDWWKIKLPWGQLIVVFACTFILFKLFLGSNSDTSKFGKGLKHFLEAETETEFIDPEIEQALENQISDKDFTFYDVLPDIEQVMPDDLPDSEPTRPPENTEYYLQAASFRSYSDAEKLRARLASKGYKSITQSREVKDKGLYYRVRLGPYTDKRKAKTVKNKLQKLGVRPLVYASKKS